VQYFNSDLKTVVTKVGPSLYEELHTLHHRWQNKRR